MVNVIYERGLTFKNRLDVTSFTIHPSTTTIEPCAFEGCSNLETLQGMLNSNISVIGEFAFSGCSKLISLDGMPDTVKVINKYAFRRCTKLITLDGISTQLTTIQESSFSECTGLISLQGLSYNVLHLGNGSFRWCDKLESFSTVGLNPDCCVHLDAFVGCTLLIPVASKQGYDTVGELGKGIGQLHFLRWSVILCVRVLRRKLEAGDRLPRFHNQMIQLLYNLTKLPSGDSYDNSEGQVLRHVIEYIGSDRKIVINKRNSWWDGIHFNWYPW
jgi:hypothetical protein